MEVYKFGGASIRHAAAIRNMASIIKKYSTAPLVVVVSAMGKTTRYLEAYVTAKVNNQPVHTLLEEIKAYHLSIIDELFSEKDAVYDSVNRLFVQLESTPWQHDDYGRFYDRVVSVGEMLSSVIVTAFLKNQGSRSIKIDATDLIKCSGRFQAGKVEWLSTQYLIQSTVESISAAQIIVTQGFIGSNQDGEVITLGKEGSDFTAAIFAACLNAEKLTIWKDVPGILSADPKLIKEATQIMHLPYSEASEMTYYGACVIHPKTIKPLANKNIPLYVRSFDEPDHLPTEILGTINGDVEPTIILKKNQCLFTFRVRDYTFVDERSLALIFSKLNELDISINMMQSSAITISVCFDYKQTSIDALLNQLQDHFTLHYMKGLILITLKNYTPSYLEKYKPQNEIILEQRSRRNCRFLVREDH